MTQQIPRRDTRGPTIPRLPGSLDPAGRTADGTEVMSLDELMDLAAETSTAPPTPTASQTPPDAPSITRPVTPPRPAPAPPSARTVRPAPPTPTPEKTGPDLRQRMSSDARQALAAGLDRAEIGVGRGKEWLSQGDNGLIAATVVLALLLLLVVAAL